MTIFGIDISNNNGPNIDMSRVKSEGFEFVFAKVSEGSGFRDWTWPRYRDSAKANGLAVAGYHYLTTDPIDAQADLFLDQLGDPTCPIMVDFEANGGGQLNYWNFVRAINARGREVNLSYEPRWYWQSIGSPALGDLPGLIQSSYVNGDGFAAALYPGDSSGNWAGFGGDTVDILQFTDKASVAGYRLDANAFRGSRTELDALLGTAIAAPATLTSEADMSWQDAQIPTQYNAAGEIVKADRSNGPNISIPAWQLLSWLDGRTARLEGELAAANGKLDQLVAAKTAQVSA